MPWLGCLALLEKEKGGVNTRCDFWYKGMRNKYVALMAGAPI